jgi:hypothetical protein
MNLLVTQCSDGPAIDSKSAVLGALEYRGASSRSMAFASEMASAGWLRVKLESGDDRYREKTYGRSR